MTMPCSEFTKFISSSVVAISIARIVFLASRLGTVHLIPRWFVVIGSCFLDFEGCLPNTFHKKRRYSFRCLESTISGNKNLAFINQHVGNICEDGLDFSYIYIAQVRSLSQIVHFCWHLVSKSHLRGRNFAMESPEMACTGRN